MAEYIKLDQENKGSQENLVISKLQKDIKFLKFLVFILGIDLVALTYIMLKLGGII